ncbi:protoporphyrinogen oxidase [Cellulomonas sp. WB94]|uniref:protoporphyrinogen/coproporphyrinogen oxidase n=1 Tax=Cellulomonas sp. WB94 TaxID=2173174 RepID=UPI000D57BFDE|nr:FAD-dependent oxidoreductase [Cellulomonas sp. WB94]PVU83020.1 protoporphyrinogen oxidase [Cellulomonas sp. WB94]
MESWDAVVVGAGVGGLVAARDLAAGGLRVLVVEQRATPGGSVGRHEVAGLTLDSGAESFATRGGAVAALADELGLGARIVAPNPRGAWVQLASGAGPLPRTGLLGIPADPWSRDVRQTIGLVGALRAVLDRVLPARVGTGAGSAGSGTTLGALVRARMGRRVLDRLVRPVVAGVHAADPDDLAVDAVSPGLLAALAAHGSLGSAVGHLRALAPAGAAVAGLDGGMHVLVDALVTDLAERGVPVRTGVRVEAVQRIGAAQRVEAEPGGTTAPTFEITLGAVPGAAPTAPTFEITLGAVPGAAPTARPIGRAEAPPELVVRADRLVLTTAEAAGLLPAVVPGLGDLHPDPGADVVLVTLVLDAPELDAAPRGTGVLVAPGVHRVRAKALTHGTAKWAWLARDAGPGRHVVRLSYGVAGSPAVGTYATPEGTEPADPRALGDGALAALALRDASTLLGVTLSADQLVASARVAWSQALPRPSAAHSATVARVRAAVAGVRGLAVCGAWVAGNGLASVVPDARRAADALLQEDRDGAPSAL